jgi:SET family sugar efflux transporter-like MFS transporter
MNTRRVGSIVSGPIIAIGSLSALGQRGIFLASAALTLAGLLIITIARRTTKPARGDDYPQRPESSPHEGSAAEHGHPGGGGPPLHPDRLG